MSWLKIDDGLFLHPKWLRTPAASRALWVTALGWCNENRTRGWVDRDVADAIADVSFFDENVPAISLVGAGLWDHTRAGHYQFLEIDQLVKFYTDDARDEWNALRSSIAPRIYARDGYKCVYCGSFSDLTIDHVTPVSRGGTNSLSNLATACRSCNSSKNDKTPEEWKGGRRVD